MLDIDARGERIDIAMSLALFLEDAVAAGEYQIGALHQLRLAGREIRRREAEIGENVHAVIDDGGGVDMRRQRIHHRRVEPQDRAGAVGDPQQLVEQSRQRRLQPAAVPIVRHAGAHGHDLGVGEAVEFEIGQVVIRRDPFLEEIHPAAACKALHQMLRTLHNEIPTQVGKADQGRIGGSRIFARRSGSGQVHERVLCGPPKLRISPAVPRCCFALKICAHLG